MLPKLIPFPVSSLLFQISPYVASIKVMLCSSCSHIPRANCNLNSRMKLNSGSYSFFVQPSLGVYKHTVGEKPFLLPPKGSPSYIARRPKTAHQPAKQSSTGGKPKVSKIAVKDVWGYMIPLSWIRLCPQKMGLYSVKKVDFWGQNGPCIRPGAYIQSINIEYTHGHPENGHLPYVKRTQS